MSSETVCIDGIEVPVGQLDAQAGITRVPNHLLGYTTPEGMRGYVLARLVYGLESFRPESNRQKLSRIFYQVGETVFTLVAKEPVEELAAALEWALGEEGAGT